MMQHKVDFSDDIDLAIQVLNNGGVILYPTDTIWGLGCDATDAAAIDRIFAIKRRAPNKSMIILVSHPAMIRHYVDQPAEKLLHELAVADHPTTGIFERGKNLPPNLVSSNGSIAIRIASDDFCRELIAKFGKPIISTSANISEHASPQNFSEIDPLLLQEVDFTVNYKRDDNTKKSPSHIIRLNEQGEVERVR